MACSTIFYNGRIISVPGSYSEVDASGLEQVGLGASGIIGVLGTAEGGAPYSANLEPENFIRLTKPDQSKQFFKSGDLREVTDMLFAPSKDPDIVAGAQSVVAMKVNPATQSLVSLPNAYGNALDLTSKDYGAFTEQINVSVAAGTTKGKLITIIFEDVTEAGNDIGGDSMFTLHYTKPTNGWDTMTSQVITDGEIKCLATRTMAGLDGDMGTPLAASGKVEVVSASAGDVGRVITVYGFDVAGAAKRELLTLNGLSKVTGTQVWAASGVLGAQISGTTAGTVTVASAAASVVILTLTAGVNKTTGLKLGVCMYGAGVATLVSSGASTKKVILVGTNASGTVTLKTITLAGVVPVVDAVVWSTITAIVLCDVEALQNVTVSMTAVWAKLVTQTTLLKARDYFNSRSVTAVGGFTFTMVTGRTSLPLDSLDVTIAAVNCLGATPTYYADLYLCNEWINNNSQYVSSVISSGATGGAPSNTSAPVFLSGGTEGSASFSDWQSALNLLKRTRVNTVVVLTGNPAVHAAVHAHCAYMGGIGRSERDGVVGAMNLALTDVPTKTELKAYIAALSSRHIRVVGQAISRYDSNGVLTEFMPPFYAAIVAGLQAGAPVGTPLTHKYCNVLAYRQDTSWNPTDDAEELVQAGCLFLETVEGIGRRIVRNITSYLVSNNIAYTEASVNQAADYAAYNFRGNMEFLVGKKGFAGSINAGKGAAINTLGLLVDGEILTTWRSLDISLIVDTLEVSVEIAPVIPINFVKNTIHLVTISQSA